MLLDPRGRFPIGHKRVFEGFVNRAALFTAAMGGVSTIEIEMASSMRLLTRTLALKKSDQSQRLRLGDRFRRYGAIAATVTTEWVKNDPATR